MSKLKQLLFSLNDTDRKTIEEKLKEKDQQIDQLKQQLAEKDKEIERLKVFEKAYYFNQTQVSQESMDLLLQNAYQVHNETQLAIQELEKVKQALNNEELMVFSTPEMIIDQQIKELKGE